MKLDMPPLDRSSYFPIIDLENPFANYIYQRVGHPMATKLEEMLAYLENGNHALAFSWGMSAIHTLLWEIIRPYNRLVISEDLYSGTTTLCKELSSRIPIWIDIIDTRDPQEVNQAIRANTKLILFETISNPRIWAADIEEIAKIAHAKNVLVAVDNTFCTPLICNPLYWGADFVIHSTTKAISGHGDTGGGAIIFNDTIWLDPLKKARTILGSIQKPDDAERHLREMQTIEIRLAQQVATAGTLANRLQGHKKVGQVFYPGLSTYPQKELAEKQLEAPGSMMAFTISGNLQSSKKFLLSLKQIMVAVSTGSVKSLIQIPAQITHRPDRQGGLPVPENLIRFSVGIEDPELLWQDLDQALNQI